MLTSKHLQAVLAPLAAVAALSAAPAAQAQATPPANCQGEPSAFWMNVVTEGLRNNNGLLAITIYPDNASRFLVKKGSIDVIRVPARAGTNRTCIFLPRAGVYAIAVYHDENGSRKIDRNSLGFPTEGGGFSNNPSTLAGLPTFRSVRLNVPQTGMSTRIQLRYP